MGREPIDREPIERGAGASAKALDLLLRLFPRRFRDECGPGMQTMFAERCREPGGTIRAWARTLPALLPAALAERLRSSYAGPPRRGDDASLAWPARWLYELHETLHDLRYATRTLAASPGFSVATVLTLALGIGANTAIFSMVNGILLRPLPHLEHASRLVEISRDLDGAYFDLSHGAFEALRSRTDVLEDVAAGTLVTMSIGGREAAEAVAAFNVTGNYFRVLGVEPALGRFFDPLASFLPRPEAAVVIGHALWHRRFAADPAVVGEDVTLNGVPLTVIGVAPEGFAGHAVALQTEIWLPVGLPVPGLRGASELANWDSGVLEGIGRLAPGVTAQIASEVLTTMLDTANQAQGAAPGEYRLRVGRYSPVPGAVRGGVSVFFAILMAMMAMVLAIACINVAGMMLSRAAERGREIAVRLALGASRRQIVRQLLTESLLLSAVAGIIGAALSVWAMRLLMLLRPPIPLPGVRVQLDLSPDLRVLGFSLLLALVTGTMFGLAPALQATRASVIPALRGAAPLAGGRSRLRALLTGGQMAFTVVLLVGSGLFIRALDQARTIDVGFSAERVWTFAFDTELAGRTPAEGAALYDAVLERVTALPAVEAASLNHKLPVSGRSSFGGVRVAATGSEETALPASHQIVSPGYFATVHVSVRGRDFVAADDSSQPPVVVISRALAGRLWPGEASIGKQLAYGGREFRVVGVAGDIRGRDLSNEYASLIYLSAGQFPNNALTLYVRAAPGAGSPVADVRAAAHAVDPGLPVLAAVALDDTLALLFLPQRVAAWATGVVGSFGLLLALVGMYGATAFAAGRRTREIGVRKALGADRESIVRLIVGQGLRAPVAGLVVGVLLAVGFTRWLSGLLFGISPVDPATYGAVVTLLVVVVTAANLIPARRASFNDPVCALRQE